MAVIKRRHIIKNPGFEVNNIKRDGQLKVIFIDYRNSKKSKNYLIDDYIMSMSIEEAILLAKLMINKIHDRIDYIQEKLSEVG